MSSIHPSIVNHPLCGGDVTDKKSYVNLIMSRIMKNIISSLMENLRMLIANDFLLCSFLLNIIFTISKSVHFYSINYLQSKG